MKCPSCGYETSRTKQRSNPENRYFHGCLIPILSEQEAFGGWSKDEIKEFLKERFVSVSKTIKVGGRIIDTRVVRSSASLTTVEWEKWMSDIRNWASTELAVYLPEPNEQEVTA